MTGFDVIAILVILASAAAGWVRGGTREIITLLSFVLAAFIALVALPLTAPHKPVLPAERFVGKSKLGPYGDFIMATDDAVGQVLKALDCTHDDASSDGLHACACKRSHMHSALETHASTLKASSSLA